MSPSGLLINLAFLSERPTGLSNYALNLLPHLRSLDPLVLCPGIKGRETRPLRSPFLKDSFRHQITSASLSPDRGLRGHLQRLLWTQFRLPQVYHQHRSKLLFCPIPEAPLAAGCATVVMVHDFIPLRFPHRRSFLTLYFQYYLPWILKQAHHIICNSHSTAQDIQTFCGIPDRRITPIPLAYDAACFYPQGNIQSNTQTNTQSNTQENYYLYVGRPDPHKNLRRALEAFAQIAPRTDAEFWIGGSPDPRYTPQLQAFVKNQSLQDRVKFLGYVSALDLPHLLNEALALVFPSLWEGFGLPVLEAMACGTPVITSNQSALPEVAGKAALLIDPYSVNSIAEALEAIVTQPGLREDLRQRSLAQAQKFSWQITGEKTTALLQQFL